MCDFEIPPMERSEAEPPAERGVEQRREEAPEAAVEQKAEQVSETADRERLDTATTEPRAFVEETGDFKQAEDIQRDFDAVADNLETRQAEAREAERTVSEGGSAETGTEEPGQHPEESPLPEPAGEGIRIPGADPGGRGQDSYAADSPWPDDEDVLAETAPPAGLDGGGAWPSGGGEDANESSQAAEDLGSQPGPTAQSASRPSEFGGPGAGAEANAERVAAAPSERPLSASAESATERPPESDGRTDQVPEIPGEPEKLPDTLVDAIDEVMRRVGESPRTGSGDSPSGVQQQPVSSTSTDSTSTSVEREGFVQGPGIPAVERFGMSRDQVVEDLMKYCKAQYDKQGGIPEGEDPQHWIADRFADYFESKFGSNPDVVKLSGMLRQAGDMKTGQPFGRTVVTRVAPSDSDFIGPAGEKGTPTPGTTTWGSKPGTTTPAGTTTGGTTPAGTMPGSTEKGGMREGRTPSESGSAPAAPESSVPSASQETAGGGSQEKPSEEPPDGGGDQPGDDRGGGGQSGGQPGGGGPPAKVEVVEPSDDEIDVDGSFEDEEEDEGGGGAGGNGGSGGNGGTPGGDGGDGSGSGDDGGGDDGGDDGDGDDDGDDDDGSTDSGDEGSDDEEEGMTVDGGSGDEPGRRQGSILGGSVPSPGGETEDAGREGPILGGGALGGGSGSDVGGKERVPIEGGTQLYPDSGGARPIDPKRAVADVEAADQARQVKKTVAK